MGRPGRILCMPLKSKDYKLEEIIMMKTEFEKLIDAEEGSLKPEVWDMVEAVYLDHPSINNTDGKQQIANIFLMPGGMEILKDMYERVMALRHCENVLKTVMDELQHEYSVRAAEIEAVPVVTKLPLDVKLPSSSIVNLVVPPDFISKALPVEPAVVSFMMKAGAVPAFVSVNEVCDARLEPRVKSIFLPVVVVIVFPVS